MTSCQFFEYLQESRPQKDILLSPINFLLTDCEWSLPHVSNMSRVFSRVVFHVLLTHVEPVVARRVKASEELWLIWPAPLQSLCPALGKGSPRSPCPSHATSQQWNPGRSARKGRSRIDLALETGKEMKRNEKEHSGPSNFCAFSSSRHYIMASIEAPPTRSVNTFKELSLSHMDLQVSSPTSVPALYKGILQHSWEAAHGLRVYSFTSCTLQTQGWTNVSQHQHHSLKSIPGLPQSKRWRAQEM